MALQKQVIPLTLGGGLDTKTDQASVPLGKWLVLENARFISPKSIRKRNGAASLTASILGGGSIAAGSSLAARSNELLISDGTSLYSYDQANTSWVNKGALPSTTLSTLSQMVDKDSLVQYDTAVHSGGLQIVVAGQLTASNGFDGILYAVVDSTTGQQVIPPTQLDVGANLPRLPKVCVLGSFFFITWVQNGNAIVAQAIAVGAPQTLVYGSPQAVTSGTTTSALKVSGAYDMTVSNGEIYVAFTNRSNTTTIFGITAVGTYTQPHSAIVAGTTPQVVCVCGNSFNNDVVVGITQGGTTATAFAYSANLSSQTLAPTTIDTQANGFVTITAISTSAVATSIQFFMGWATGAGFDDASFIRKVTLGAAYVAGAVSTIGRQLKIAGKPALRSGTVYLPAWLTGVPISGATSMAFQNTWMLLDSSGLVVAKAFAGNGAGYSAYGVTSGSPLTLPETPVSGSQLLPPVGVISYLYFGATAKPSIAMLALNIVQVSFSDTSNQFTKAQLGGPIVFSGSVPRIYDGARVVEQGFHSFPEIVSIAHAPAGTSVGAGTYQYAVVYKWIDATGQAHRSAPSPAVSVTVAAGDNVTLTISTLRQTQKQNVLIEIFRTLANGTTQQEIVGNTPVSNDTTNATVTYVDTAPDLITQAQRQIYTTGGVLPSAAPPPLNSVIIHRNRVIGIDPTTGQLAYTKQFIPGSTGQPIEFSGFLTMNIDTRGGNPTALASLDEKLIIFKSDRIFMVLGQGPDATGQNNDFTDAVQVSTDTGCAAPKSIVVVPDGLMFKSPKGIYLLNRALQVSYIGADVEAHNAANVTSACLIPSTNEVRFSLDSGKVLVYDYRAEQWGVFTNISAVDATIWGGQYTYLTAAGIASQETPGAFVDPGSTFIKMKAVSAWVQLAQIQGFQRVWRVLVLGQYKSAHQLTVKLAHDFSASFDQQNDITVASDPAPYQYRVHCRTQKSGALQISIEDVSTGTNGESMSLSGFMLEVGIKKGAFKPSAAKSVG